MMEKTGLTDLILICENNVELKSTDNNRIGHTYKSNDADCSTDGDNYIRGLKMQSGSTMIHNFAIACTKDFDRSIIKERILKYIPEIPKGETKLRKSDQNFFPVIWKRVARPSVDRGRWSSAQVCILHISNSITTLKTSPQAKRHKPSLLITFFNYSNIFGFYH